MEKAKERKKTVFLRTRKDEEGEPRAYTTWGPCHVCGSHGNRELETRGFLKAA